MQTLSLSNIIKSSAKSLSVSMHTFTKELTVIFKPIDSFIFKNISGRQNKSVAPIYL